MQNLKMVVDPLPFLPWRGKNCVGAGCFSPKYKPQNDQRDMATPAPSPANSLGIMTRTGCPSWTEVLEPPHQRTACERALVKCHCQSLHGLAPWTGSQQSCPLPVPSSNKLPHTPGTQVDTPPLPSGAWVAMTRGNGIHQHHHYCCYRAMPQGILPQPTQGPSLPPLEDPPSPEFGMAALLPCNGGL